MPWCSSIHEDSLLRRYSETRRPHPLGKDVSGAKPPQERT